jgi:hypothetical protein
VSSLIPFGSVNSLSPHQASIWTARLPVSIQSDKNIAREQEVQLLVRVHSIARIIGQRDGNNLRLDGLLLEGGSLGSLGETLGSGVEGVGTEFPDIESDQSFAQESSV